MNEELLVYLVTEIWQENKEDAYYAGNYFHLGSFLFTKQEIQSLYELRELSPGGDIDEMYGRFIKETKLWHDTITA